MLLNEGNIYETSRSIRCKNRENNAKENNYTIQYLRDIAICLYSWSCILLFTKKNIRCSNIVFGSFLAHCGSFVHDRNTVVFNIVWFLARF